MDVVLLVLKIAPPWDVQQVYQDAADTELGKRGQEIGIEVTSTGIVGLLCVGQWRSKGSGFSLFFLLLVCQRSAKDC